MSNYDRAAASRTVKTQPSFRHVLLPVSLGTGLSLLGDTSLYTVLPTHLEAAGITLATVGVILSANRFVRLLLNGPAGIAADRWPRRLIFVPAVFVGAISTLLYAVTTGFWPLLVGRLLWGLAWSGIWVAGNAIVLDVTQEHNRGRWVGLYHLSFFMGAAGGAMLGGLLTDLLGYHVAMAVFASLTFIGALCTLIFLPETSKLRPLSSETVAQATPVHARRSWPEIVSATALFGVNRIVMAGVLFATFSLYLAQRLGESARILSFEIPVTTLTGLLLGSTTLVSMLTAPTLGALSDRFQSRWRVASGGLVAGIVGFALLSLGSPAAILFGLPMASVSSGSNQGLSTSLIGDLSREARRGRQLGVLFTAGDLGSAVGPPLAYSLLPAIGLSRVYLLCAGLLALMFLLALRWSLRPPRRLTTAH